MKTKKIVKTLQLCAVMIILAAGSLAVCRIMPLFSDGGAINIMADLRESLPVPIIMYHGLTDNPEKESEYVISAARFEEDLKWLSENNYTTILPSQLAAYVLQGSRLPHNPVIISFDDGYRNNYALAFPLLQKYNMKAVISVIGSEAEKASADIYRNLSQCSLSLGEIALMSRSGLIEFANHSYNLHTITQDRKGADKLPQESADSYRARLLQDLSVNQNLLEAASGRSPLAFAWPYGAYPADKAADPILEEAGIIMSFTSYQHTSTVTAGSPGSLYGLGRYLRTPDFDMKTILP